MIFTRDNLWHALAALVLTPIMGPVGNALLFYAREMEQAAVHGERWRPNLWSWAKHFEWIVPGLVGAAEWGVIALVKAL